MIKVKTMTLTTQKVGESDGLAEGEFTGYASVFDNVDSYGDVVRKGAFAESLATYGENGAGVPAYWGHRMDDPDFNIGVTKSAVEDDRGLLVHVALDMESPKGAYVHRLIAEKRVKQMSFSYEVEDGAFIEEKDAEPYFEIRKARLFEVSVVPVGANPEAELTGVKEALAVKVGRRHAKADADKLQQIRDLVDELLAAEQDPDGPDGDEDETGDDEPVDEASKTIKDALAKLAQLHNRKDEAR